jgi:hypothetical protein
LHTGGPFLFPICRCIAIPLSENPLPFACSATLRASVIGAKPSANWYSLSGDLCSSRPD